VAKVAVLLTGCGRLDGTDIHEAVLLFTALERRGDTFVCFAPEGNQQVVADHATVSFESEGELRSMLQEATRLAPGPVRPLAEAPTAMLDGVILPGGAGAFRGLCEPGGQGIGGGALLPDVRSFLQSILDKGGKVGAIGTASIVLDRLLDRPLGSGTGASGSDMLQLDPNSATAYCSGLMMSASLIQAETGIRKLVDWMSARKTEE
jgi:enhancing lycopene biosynthesis protein 2